MFEQRIRSCAVFLLLFCAGASLPACNSELSEACDDWCVQRAACDRDKGETPSDTCETSCVEFQDDSFVDKVKECEGKTSCDYTVCVAD
jgi:hypothetical protein